MRTSVIRVTVLAVVAALALPLGAFADGAVAVHTRATKTKAATHECKDGHKIEQRYVALDAGVVPYALQYSGCLDPSHNGQHPSSEGNFGMPVPYTGNWYWGGFMRVLINGTDAALYDVLDWRAIETGERGIFQVIFAHPDAEVSLRFMMLPQGNHLLTDLQWHPREGAELETVVVALRCYPSFFTAARGRNGDRHCRTPRTDQGQGTTLEIQPGEDGWLYYYDTVFDVERGEGTGPCAALAGQEGLLGGRVSIGSYAVNTTLRYDPAAGAARLGFYDFSKKTNAEAEAYLAENGAADLEELLAADFRPAAVQSLDIEALRAEATLLLNQAGDDGAPFVQRVQGLLAKVEALTADAIAGDLRAEADLGAEVEASADLFWKLKAFAVLNNPDG